MNKLAIQKLALGTAQFGMPYGIANKTGQPSIDEVAKIIQLARKSGIHTIDTAIAYGNSEKFLGEIGVQDFQVVTKLPEIPHSVNIQSWVHQQVEISLTRLRIDQLYGLLLHKPQQLNTEFYGSIIRALLDLKEEGIIQKIGISVYSPEELEEIIPKFTPDILQLPFNLIDRRFLTTGWLEKLNSFHIEVHSRSAFLQGVLLMPYQEVIQKFPDWTDLWDQWFRWLEHTQTSPITACLKFVLGFPQIHRVIVGVDHCRQLAEIVETLNQDCPLEQLPTIATDDVRLVNPSIYVGEIAMTQDQIFQQVEADNFFLRNSSKPGGFSPKEDIITYLLDLYSLVDSESTVLEVGAANGYRLAQLHQKTGCKVYAVEPSPLAVTDGKQQFPFIEFTCATAAEMELHKEFDILVLHGVFCWIDRRTLLTSIAKIDKHLKCGGHLIISDFQLPYFVKNPYHHLPEQQVFTYKQRYRDIFLQTGSYLEIAYLCYNHDQMMKFTEINLSNMFCVSLLRKQDLYVDQPKLGF